MPYDASETRYEKMPYNRCGRSGLKLPAISLGWWYNFGGVDRLENGRAIARRAFDLGITHFDLANNYGPPPDPPRRPSACSTSRTSGPIGTSSSFPQGRL